MTIPAVLDAPAFDIDGESVTWAGVIANARRRGAWEQVEAELREGAACLAHDRAHGAEPSRSAVDAESARFRHERRLTAAEDMEAWLAGWALRVRDWLEHVRRVLARDAHAADAAALPFGEAGERELWASAVCSGAIERWAARLARERAVAAALAARGERATPGTDPVDRFRRAVLTPAAVDAEIGARPLDWTRLVVETLTCASTDVAAEIRLCLRDDAIAPSELAKLDGVGYGTGVTYLEDMDPRRRAALAGARPGDVLGPFPGGGCWQVLVLRRRAAPALDDPEVRRRAEALLLARAMRKEVENRVVWHDHS